MCSVISHVLASSYSYIEMYAKHKSVMSPQYVYNYFDTHQKCLENVTATYALPVSTSRRGKALDVLEPVHA